MLLSGRRAILCGTAITTLLATGAVAQDIEGFTLDPIVLGESKREVQTQTAVPITTIDEEEIDDRQASTIAELIDSVPGVNLVNGSTPSGSGINIRGFGANATFGTDQKVAIISDGASVGAEEIYRIGTQLFSDPELFKEVDVIRGTVGSFEYGSGIVGGVVILETKDASDLTEGEPGFALRQSLQSSSNGDGLLSSTTLAYQSDDSRFEAFANYTWREQDSQIDGDGDEIGNSSFELPSYKIKLLYYLDDAQEQSIEFSYSDTSTAERDVLYDTFITTADAFGSVDRDIVSQTAVLTYRNNPLDNDLLDLEVSLSWANQDIDQEYLPGTSTCDDPSNPCGFPGGFPPGGFPVVNADHSYETTKLTVKNTALFTTGAIDHELRAGFEFIQKDRLDANSAPGGTDTRFAVFAIDEMSFGNGWTVTPALRYETQRLDGDDDTLEEVEHDALMGGLSVRYAFDNGFAVFGSAAYTESFPILDDYLTTDGRRDTAEKATTYELGFSYDSTDVFQGGDEVAFKLNAYRTTLEDVTSYFGRDEIEVDGIEIEASYANDAGFYIDLNANIADGTQTRTNGATSTWDRLPQDSVRATFGQRFGEELDLSWEVVAAAEETRNGDTFDRYVVHNLRATYKPQSGVLEGTEIRLGVENALDELYRPALSTRNAPGRNVKLTLTRTF